MRQVDEAAYQALDEAFFLIGREDKAFKAGVSFANSKDNERILCAATTDGKGVVPTYREYPSRFNQGFLTSKGRFVDRKEAAKIAWDMGQIPEQVEELTSEHLY